MQFRKMMAAAVLTIAATGIAATTAHGQPVAPASEVGYTAAVAPDRSSATVTLTNGRFAVAPDGSSVTVLAPDGAVLASVPTAMRSVAGQQVQVAPAIDASATTLTLTKVGAPVAPEVNADAIGAAADIGDPGTIFAGAAIGCVIGALIGAIFLILPAIPGCVIGGVIGGIIGANQ